MNKKLPDRKLCIFDLDGTVDLTDTKLSAQFLKMSNSGIVFVVATGRTNSYVKEVCKKNNIIPPRFIIGDNGGTIYDVRRKKYLKRTVLSDDTRLAIISEYISSGGKVDDIRYTDGENVYAFNGEEIKSYYEDDETIIYMNSNDLLQAISRKNENITKITLAGNRKMMKKMVKFIERRGIKCWTDIGRTKFPVNSRKNYRLDITDGQSSKGEAVEFLTKNIGILNFTCIGNGPNDFSMFKFALDSGMPITIVQNKEKNGEITEESEELILMVQEYADQIGMLDKVNVENYPINRVMWKIEREETAEERRRKFAYGLEYKIDDTDKKYTSQKNSGRNYFARKVQHRSKEGR